MLLIILIFRFFDVVTICDFEESPTYILKANCFPHFRPSEEGKFPEEELLAFNFFIILVTHRSKFPLKGDRGSPNSSNSLPPQHSTSLYSSSALSKTQ